MRSTYHEGKGNTLSKGNIKLILCLLIGCVIYAYIPICLCCHCQHVTHFLLILENRSVTIVIKLEITGLDNETATLVLVNNYGVGWAYVCGQYSNSLS